MLSTVILYVPSGTLLPEASVPSQVKVRVAKFVRVAPVVPQTVLQFADIQLDAEPPEFTAQTAKWSEVPPPAFRARVFTNAPVLV